MTMVAPGDINMTSKNYQVLMNEYNYSLNMPLSTRCSHLSTLISNSSLKDLKELYGTLVEDIFGFRNKHDWDLLKLDSSYDVSSFQALRLFLSAEGLLLQLAYKLSEDVHLRYSFPISCLPAPVSQALYQGKITEFYAQKVSFSPDRQLSSSLQLNAFEFYLYHFTYFIINSYSADKETHMNSKPQDTLYELLLEEYLCYFLPKDSLTVPVCPTSLISPPSPVKTPSPPSSFKTSPNKPGWNNTTPAKPGWNTTTPVKSSPPSIVFQTPSPTPKQHKPFLKLSTIFGSTSPPNEISELAHSSAESRIHQSELFAEIITEMYLNAYVLERTHSHYTPFIESYIRNHHHVWTIRVLIKHFHCFTNTSFGDQHGLRLSNSLIDPFSSLKSYLLSKYVQKKLFIFLKMIFQHWPLDETFRAPLETWLSYIQPWRYSPKPVESANFINHWQKFVTANLLFYTPFLMQVLLRFFRMDLTTVKNAYMLYRVTKVFYQEYLDVMLIEAEKSYEIGMVSSSNVKGLQSFSAPSSSYTSKFQSTFQNMDFSLNSYVPLRSTEFTAKVSRLLFEIISAQERVPRTSRNFETLPKDERSFLSQVSSWFDDKVSDPFTDVEKLNFFLDTSAAQLCGLFKIDRESPTSTQLNVSTVSNLSRNVSTNQHSNDRQTVLIKELNPGFTRKIIFQSNPDTHRARTYEWEWLVKLFGEISDCLNIKYSQQIIEFYDQPTFVGRICRQLFAAPLVYKELVKSKDMASVQQKDVQLPPRILLRPLASKYIISRLILGFAILYYFADLHFLLSFFVLFSIWIFYKVLKAITNS